MSTYLNLLIISGLVIASYIFNVMSRYTRIPSALILLASGVGLRILFEYNGFLFKVTPILIEMLGTVGLVVIVLEAALDLHVSRDKIKLIRQSFGAALLILVMSMLLIAGLLSYWLDTPFVNCLVYATPLSIISSAIVIPSIQHLTAEKREFTIYESSFSDIIGIIFFNYLTLQNEQIGWQSMALFSLNIVYSLLISLGISFVLLAILYRITIQVKFFLLFSILVLLYALGKMAHLPSLLLILVFGIIINNTHLFTKRLRTDKYLRPAIIEPLLENLKLITAETSFLIRTFFFFLFGYSLNISVLADPEVIFVGSLVVFCLVVIRFLYLQLFLKSAVLPELFLMPRGLITILLFYKIPSALQLGAFNEGIILFVIIATSILMTIGLMTYNVSETTALE
ncbi:MAG: sodium:proton exchanger [Spirosomataceae bacterium]